ncbi:hypothetical protein C0J50_12608 [Silurus asotus]|uniref:Uncharacterized protein n=1 Tax=Silurus asotus TaxID=30991 RepID=A0AAD5B7R6_SILAS|nr:hypothetical protein C0J50_12608 [Silurus asotus]
MLRASVDSCVECVTEFYTMFYNAVLSAFRNAYCVIKLSVECIMEYSAERVKEYVCRKGNEKTTAVNATSAPQYCVLEFPNPAGEKVRSTEERVEYSPIVFPPRKTMAQGNQIKPMTQQNQAKMTTLQSHRETDKVPDKPNTSKPKPKQKYAKKKITPNHTVSSSKV